MRLDIRRIGAIKERDEVVGNQTRVKVVKNKVAPPFKQVEFDIMYGEGVSKIGELIDLGVKAGVVEKSGAWFSYDSTRLGQGRENSKNFLRQNPEMAAKIEGAIRQNSGLIADRILTTSIPPTPTWTPEALKGARRAPSSARAPPPGFLACAAARPRLGPPRPTPAALLFVVEL